MWFGTKCWWKADRSGPCAGSWDWRGSRSGSTSRKRLRSATRRRGRGRDRCGTWSAAGGALLAESAQWTGGKQQLTATRLHELLVAEGHRVGVTLVKEAVAEWKRQRREVFVPLTYRPGESRRGRLLRGARRSRRHPSQGVALSDAADVLGPRLRVDLRAPGPDQFSRWDTCGPSRISRACPAGSRTTIFARPSSGSSSAASAR